jgi:drug/metabolite transporter (DMT)-like permease
MAIVGLLLRRNVNDHRRIGVYTPHVLRTAVEALIALLLFGCIPVVVKMISANPYTIGIFRLAFATVVLGTFMAVRGELRHLARKDLTPLAVIGFLFFGHWLTLFFAVKASSASIGAIGLSTYGVDLLILGIIFAGERPRPVVIIAVVLAAAGAVLVVPKFDLHNDTALGMLLACASALMYAGLPLLHQRWAHIPTGIRTLGQFGFALLFFSLFVTKTNWDLTPRDWAGLLFLAIGVTLIAHSLWVRVTTRLTPSATSILYYGNIPVALALSVLVLGEPLTLRTISGAALIITGGVLGLITHRRERGQVSQPA